MPTKATKILPRLYLGDMNDAITISDSEANSKKPKWLVLCCCNGSEREGRCATKHDRELVIPILKYSDYHWSLNEPMVNLAVDRLKLLLKEAKNLNRKVLVHCVVGQERSPLVVQKYLIKYKDMEATKAFKYIQKRRPFIIRCDYPEYFW